MSEPEKRKSCKTCVYADLPANDEVCKQCWNYQRWKNWEPLGGSKK